MAVPRAVVAEGDVTSLSILASPRAVSHRADIDCYLGQFSVSQAELFSLGSHYFQMTLIKSNYY